MQVVVAGALICGRASGASVLAARRRRPPELAGLWELPGGKVAAGETEADALVRELREELGIDVEVGERLGSDVPLSDSLVLRAYRVTLTGGEPHPHDHGELRWVAAADLHDLPWVPADRAWLTDLARALGESPA